MTPRAPLASLPRAAALALLLLAAPWPGGPPPLAAAPGRDVAHSEGRLWGTVRTVVDGGQLLVATPELQRLELSLAGVALPERARGGRAGQPATPGQPFAEEAAAMLRGLLLDKQVRLDTYGRNGDERIQAVVWLGEINVNLTLVKEGMAWVDPDFAVVKVRAGLEVAERQARVGRYGLWALPDPEPPWEHRARVAPADERAR